MGNYHFFCTIHGRLESQINALHYKDEQLTIFDFCQDAIIPDTITPEFTELPFKRFPYGSWVGYDSLMEKMVNAADVLAINFAEIPFHFLRKFNLLSQVCALLLQAGLDLPHSW